MRKGTADKKKSKNKRIKIRKIKGKKSASFKPLDHRSKEKGSIN